MSDCESQAANRRNAHELPEAEEVVAMSTTATRKQPTVRRQKHVEPAQDRAKVLLVDDHEMLRQGMRLLIEQQKDLQVCGEATDEISAVKQFRAAEPDLVIVDLSLKEGDGIELIKRIKLLDPEARMLVYSMHDERVYGERALRAGAKGYVSKQQPARAVLQAIRRVLAGSMHFSGEMTQRLLERAAASEPMSPASPVESLSDRELEVFEMIGRGLTTRSIAASLHLSPRTVDTYRERLKIKLALANSAELHYRAVQWVLKGT
jgi:DNA-binding NarL/FixJ family response regulator